MNFMLNSSSSSSSFHYLTTTLPPNNHHRTAEQPPSDDAGEDNVVGDLMMPLFTRSSSEANDSTANTNSTTAIIPVSLIEKEHMFDKAVTPSDVGKLNRLVIPKQHAEKYFPLDSSSNEKGLLLNFEDPSGKPWRFRYSYWNSSQSYVMTKGWSRFVKEKKLDAGDIVSFKRGLGELGKDRLFIDWRRRPGAPELVQPSFPLHHHQFSFHHHRSMNPWTCASNPMILQPQHHHYSGGNASTSPYGYSSHTTAVINGNPCPPGSVLYLRSGAGYGSGSHGSQRYSGTMQLQRSVNEQKKQMVFDSVPVVQGKKAAGKRLRLFGVNMDCSIPAESDECDRGLSSKAALSNHTVPILHDFVGFDHSSSSSAPLLQLRPYNDYQNGDDEGKGTSMSLELDI